MQLPDLKDLEKVIDLCRRKGVGSITIGEVKLELKDEAPPTKYQKRKERQAIEHDSANPLENFPNRVLTEEELVYYSSGGLPPNPEEAQ